jgi:hypothetical protein
MKLEIHTVSQQRKDIRKEKENNGEEETIQHILAIIFCCNWHEP